jgi:four helix bundle protein
MIAAFRMPISELTNRTDALKARTKDFAIRIFHLVEALPKSLQGRAVANQIIRSGTSVAANYRAACRARSRAEFIAKIGMVEEEADETLFWLELIVETRLLPVTKLKPLLREEDEIVSIMAASRKSAIANRQSAIR